MELLGNTATDLLNPGAKVDILEDKFGKVTPAPVAVPDTGQVNLTGLREVEVEQPEQFLALLREAAEQRNTSSTLKNDSSSRSHAVYR